MSYGMTADLLKDVLPVDASLNSSTVRNHLQAVAQRQETALGEEQFAFIDGCPRDWGKIPQPDSPITVGIDGGYVRDWTKKKTNFEVIAGKSVPTDGEVKRFVKKQQMQWIKAGAHLLLQTRTAVLNGDLDKKFQNWYPNFRSSGGEELKMAA